MKISNIKAFLALVLVLAIIGGAIVWMAGDENPGNEKPQNNKRGAPQLVEVEVARRGEIARTLEVTGEVVAADTVVIAATKEGPISYCPWREGDRVQQGEKLVEIDRRVHRAELQQAKAALEVARAKLADLKAGTRPEEIEQAKANVEKWKATLQEAQTAYERQQQLIAKDFTSRQAVDQVRERMDVAKAELANAQERLRMLEAGPTKTEIAVQKAAVDEAAAKLDLAQAHLEECLIKAPFDGIITEVHVRPGDLSTPRSPLIEMFNSNSLVLRFSVPEAHTAGVAPGLAVEARLDAWPEKTFQGEVVRGYPQLDPIMRTRTVEAKLEDSGRLMPHQFARITLTLGSAEGAIIVPSVALRETPDGKHVAFIIEDSKALRRTIEIGIEQDRMIQVTKGLSPGEKVVIAGNEMLKNNAPVRVVGAGKKRPDDR